LGYSISHGPPQAAGPANRAMLTYAYACEKCGEFEHEQRITDPKLERCPSCGSKVARLISGGQAFITKGGGGSIKGCAEAATCSGHNCSSCHH
jgi:putative FmdB family regulatory protein